MSEDTNEAITPASPANDGWDTAESGSFIKFEEVGAEVSGLVVGYEKKDTAKGPANDYSIITKTGKQSFYAPKDLHDKLSGCIIKYGLGKFVVKATFKEKTKTASGNDFKIFDVKHKAADEKAFIELGINPDAINDF